MPSPALVLVMAGDATAVPGLVQTDRGGYLARADVKSPVAISLDAGAGFSDDNSNDNVEFPSRLVCKKNSKIYFFLKSTKRKTINILGKKGEKLNE